MDLDGTTADSESFWINIIKTVMQEVLHNKNFTFDKNDVPFISGHSVTEHLSYCIKNTALQNST